MRIGPLREEDAVAMLRGRIVASSDERTTSALARLCDGIPAALAIVAALSNSPSIDADELLRALRPPPGRLRMLTSGNASMLAVLRNSYRLLSIEAAGLLRVIANPTFGDVTPLTVSRRVARDRADVEESLDELVDFGLLEASSTGEYRLLETIRLFARGTL